uniref:Uncharacterized protein n=1 Tax=Peronospora matthiolae TaxID=2874970 RepID=A0AAV1TAG0_9STRA
MDLSATKRNPFVGSEGAAGSIRINAAVETLAQRQLQSRPYTRAFMALNPSIASDQLVLVERHAAGSTIVTATAVSWADVHHEQK